MWTATARKDGLVEIREGYIRSAYEEADATLALIRSLMPSNSMVLPRPITALPRSGRPLAPARSSSTPGCKMTSNVKLPWSYFGHPQRRDDQGLLGRRRRPPSTSISKVAMSTAWFRPLITKRRAQQSSPLSMLLG